MIHWLIMIHLTLTDYSLVALRLKKKKAAPLRGAKLFKRIQMFNWTSGQFDPDGSVTTLSFSFKIDS